MIEKLAASMVLCLVIADGSLAQTPSPTLIPEEATCIRCTIVGRVMVTLGATDGPGALIVPPLVLADARGRYWALSSESVPIVFDKDGQFITQIGRIGQGPGEFGLPIAAMVTPGDSVAVFDGDGQRTTVIGPDLGIGRMIRTPFQVLGGVAIDWPSEVIVTANVYTGNRPGSPLHRISFATAQAVDVASFAPANASPATTSRRDRQTIAPAKAGIWSADVNRYRLTLWSPTGERLQTLERTPPWFATPASSSGFGTSTTPPPPGLIGVREDPETGQLWVFARVPAPTWREAWPPRTSTGVRELSLRNIAMEKLFTTRIEVLNPKTGRVIARGALNDLVLSALPNKRVATYVVDAAGIPHVNIVSLRIGVP